MSSTIVLPNGNTYNLVALPQTPGLAQISVTMEDSVANVASPFVPGVNQTQAWPGADCWSLSFTLPKMNVQTAAPWRGFMAELRGISGVFQIGDPFGAIPQGAPDAASGGPQCATSGSYNLTSATSLLTKNWTPNVYGQLLAGDYIQLGYHLHQVCEDVNSDNDGNATIQIWPSLRDTPLLNAPIIVTGCVGLFRLKDNTRTFHGDFTRLIQMSFNAIEVR